MAAPVLSHLDPEFVPLLDDVRASLHRLFRADSRALTIATSGTGTSAMEAAVAHVVSDGMRGVVVVTGLNDTVAKWFIGSHDEPQIHPSPSGWQIRKFEIGAKARLDVVEFTQNSPNIFRPCTLELLKSLTSPLTDFGYQFCSCANIWLFLPPIGRCRCQKRTE